MTVHGGSWLKGVRLGVYRQNPSGSQEPIQMRRMLVRCSTCFATPSAGPNGCIVRYTSVLPSKAIDG
jgi:hypothetical protein